MQAYSEVHVTVCKVSFKADCTLEIVECRGVLFSVHIYEAKVKRCYPLKGIKVEGSLQAGNSCYEFLFAKEAHSNVVPELS